ncbi:A/G-specific adenine glycosylase [Rubrivivax albus]|uniref:Adenine DNA glycosylase n=1 Tax=Rubrivivax albus TaxID=2499835 RepID=A0A437JZL4_9BURK|nr:A/G-specific adenine glycosylase [Rubrivivax albus]RVT53546.1 A/G-specific adenine glycosylase [Rubrivivax albus]
MSGSPSSAGAEGAGLAECVIAWQLQHGRHTLPWQQTRDPYRVWLSEIMLQQTQVSTVLDYYARFLARFPDVLALASAPLDDVLAQWSGLGYYSRARNLHRCAQAVVAQHGGRFPDGAAGLATLPGIGRSTAAAIAAFCHGERVAILDGNVKRVLTRVLGFDGDLAETRHEKQLWTLAESLLPQTGIETYTQGLMDLGATVCTTRQPRCDACPLTARCVAKTQGRPQAYPVKTRNLRRRAWAHALLWLAQGEQVWLVQRPPRGVWAGLWTLPQADDVSVWLDLAAAAGAAAQVDPAFVHVLTHADWTLTPVRVVLAADATVPAGLEGRWFDRNDALALGLPAPIRRLIS